MERMEEIKQILRGLLGETEKAIDKNQYSNNLEDIVKSSKEVVRISLIIDKYINEIELDSLQD